MKRQRCFLKSLIAQEGAIPKKIWRYLSQILQQVNDIPAYPRPSIRLAEGQQVGVQSDMDGFGTH